MNTPLLLLALLALLPTALGFFMDPHSHKDERKKGSFLSSSGDRLNIAANLRGSPSNQLFADRDGDGAAAVMASPVEGGPEMFMFRGMEAPPPLDLLLLEDFPVPSFIISYPGHAISDSTLTCQPKWISEDDGDGCAVNQFGCPDVACDGDLYAETSEGAYDPWCCITEHCETEGVGWDYCSNQMVVDEEIEAESNAIIDNLFLDEIEEMNEGVLDLKTEEGDQLEENSDTNGDASDVINDAMSDAMSDVISDVISDATSDAMSDAISDATSDERRDQRRH